MVHERVIVWRERIVAVCAVQVGQPEHVRELVAECAYADHSLGVAHQLVGTGIVPYLHTVRVEAHPLGEGVCRVRPYAVHAAAVSLAVAGVEYVNVVNPAVIVAVILAEVNLIVEFAARLCHHFVGKRIIVCPVVGHLVVECHRPVDIKLGCELPGGVLDEIVVCAAGCAEGGIAWLVEHVVELVMAVCERAVCVLHEYNEGFLLPRGRESGV